MEELEEINDKLERNKISLEEAIELYKRGIELINHCKDKLNEAKGEIKKISEEEEIEVIDNFE